MKTLKILLLVVAVILSGFAKDSQTGKTETGVVVPLKFRGATIPDYSSGWTVCTPVESGAAIVRSGWMQGHQTHGGVLIPEMSTWVITSCTAVGTTTISVANGTITVANGDSYFLNAIMVINHSTFEVSCDITINDGVGRFEGVTGELTLNGFLDSNIVVTWSGEGFLNFPK